MSYLAPAVCFKETQLTLKEQVKSWELWIDKQGRSAQFGVMFQSSRGGRALSTACKLLLAKPLPKYTMKVLSNTYGPRRLVQS